MRRHESIGKVNLCRSSLEFERNRNIVFIDCLWFVLTNGSKSLLKRTDRYRLANFPLCACCDNVKDSETVLKVILIFYSFSEDNADNQATNLMRKTDCKNC